MATSSPGCVSDASSTVDSGMKLGTLVSTLVMSGRIAPLMKDGGSCRIGFETAAGLEVGRTVLPRTVGQG